MGVTESVLLIRDPWPSLIPYWNAAHNHWYDISLKTPEHYCYWYIENITVSSSRDVWDYSHSYIDSGYCRQKPSAWERWKKITNFNIYNKWCNVDMSRSMLIYYHRVRLNYDWCTEVIFGMNFNVELQPIITDFWNFVGPSLMTVELFSVEFPLITRSCWYH